MGDSSTFPPEEKRSVVKEQKEHEEHFYYVTSGQAWDSDLLCKGRWLMQNASVNIIESTIKLLLSLALRNAGSMQHLWKVRPNFIPGLYQNL